MERCLFPRRPFPILGTLQTNRDAVVVKLSVGSAESALFHGSAAMPRDVLAEFLDQLGFAFPNGLECCFKLGDSFEVLRK